MHLFHIIFITRINKYNKEIYFNLRQHFFKRYAKIDQLLFHIKG